MVTTTSLKVGESLSIGLYFNDNYQLPTTCNLIVFIGGVCVGNLFTQQPEIDRVGVYYTIRLSSRDTSKMRGYRDLIVILDDPEGFGNKKTIVGGILFDRLADEFITTSENQGYNMLIGMTVDQSVVSGNVELIEAIKGEKGDPFEYSDFTEDQLESLKVKGDKGDKGEDAVLPDGIVVDLDYVHTDNNYTDNEKSVVSNTSGINTGDQDLSNLLSLQHLSDFNHADIVHQNRVALDSVSGINTGDQDLSGLATKLEVASGLSLKVDKEAGKGLSTTDYTAQEKLKLAGISENANNYILPSDVVQDANYVHTDNNFTDSLLITLSNQSGVNTGDQDLSGLVEKKANHSLVSDTEIDKLSEYPELLEETTNKVVSDTGELVSIPTPSGGYANNLYFGETDSDVAGYKILTYIADTAETIKTVTANSSAGVVTAQTFLYPTGVSVSNFPSGLWSLKLWGNISASAGVSQVGFTYFKRSVAGVETDLFTLWSEEVNNTSDIWIDVIGTQPSYLVDPTDRMGLRLLFKTTSGTNKTLTYSIGDGYAAFVNNPNQIRHSQTRDKNGEADFQHVDERINEIPVKVGTASYTLLNRRQNLITGTLPNGVNSTLVLPALISGERNEAILHFKTNATAAPTLVYSGFTPVWLNGNAISMKVNKQYTIVFEQINGIVKTSWGEY